MSRAGTGIRWTRWRRTTQLVVALFYLILPFANARGIHDISGTLASLKVGRFDLVDPAAGFSAVLAGRHFPLKLFLGTVPVILLAFALGPVFCSWVCPWGLVSECVDSLKPRQSWAPKPWLPLRRIRPLALAAWLIFGAIASIPLAAILSAPRLITTLAGEIVYLRLVSPVTGVLIAALLLLEVLGPRRIWCRAVCPVGALTNYFRCKATLRVVILHDRCSCSAVPHCFQQCRWGLDPRAIKPSDGCTTCMRCVETCPSASLTFRSINAE